MWLFYALYGSGLGFFALLYFSIWWDKRKVLKNVKSHSFIEIGSGPKGILKLCECTKCHETIYFRDNLPSSFCRDIEKCPGNVKMSVFNEAGEEVTCH